MPAGGVSPMSQMDGNPSCVVHIVVGEEVWD